MTIKNRGAEEPMTELYAWNICRIMREQRLTDATAAALCHLSVTEFQQYRAGIVLPDAQATEKILKGLRCKILDLCRPMDEKTANEPARRQKEYKNRRQAFIERRTKVGLSQQALAKKMHTSQWKISAFERGVLADKDGSFSKAFFVATKLRDRSPNQFRTPMSTMDEVQAKAVGESVGKALKESRRKYTAFAKELGVKPYAVRRLVSGKYLPCEELTTKVADALGTTVRELSNGSMEEVIEQEELYIALRVLHNIEDDKEHRVAAENLIERLMNGGKMKKNGGAQARLLASVVNDKKPYSREVCVKDSSSLAVRRDL